MNFDYSFNQQGRPITVETANRVGSTYWILPSSKTYTRRRNHYSRSNIALLRDFSFPFTGNLRSFLHLQANRFDMLYFLARNHACYNNGNPKRSKSEQLEWMRNVCKRTYQYSLPGEESLCFQMFLIPQGILQKCPWMTTSSVIYTRNRKNTGKMNVAFTVVSW